jgi:hypothetical protein
VVNRVAPAARAIFDMLAVTINASFAIPLLSLAQYRDVVFFSLILSLGFFTLTFYQSFRPASLFLTPYLISVCFGFSLLSLGQSISQTEVVPFPVTAG